MKYTPANVSCQVKINKEIKNTQTRQPERKCIICSNNAYMNKKVPLNTAGGQNRRLRLHKEGIYQSRKNAEDCKITERGV